MRTYQLYLINAEDEIEDVTATIRCGLDVIRRVEPLADLCDIEIWDGSTFIHRCTATRAAPSNDYCWRETQREHALVTLNP